MKLKLIMLTLFSFLVTNNVRSMDHEKEVHYFKRNDKELTEKVLTLFFAAYKGRAVSEQSIFCANKEGKRREKYDLYKDKSHIRLHSTFSAQEQQLTSIIEGHSEVDQLDKEMIGQGVGRSIEGNFGTVEDRFTKCQFFRYPQPWSSYKTVYNCSTVIKNEEYPEYKAWVHQIKRNAQK